MTTDIQSVLSVQCPVPAAHLLIVLKSIRASAVQCCVAVWRLVTMSWLALARYHGTTEAAQHGAGAASTPLHWPHRGSTSTHTSTSTNNHLTRHQAGHHPAPSSGARSCLLLSLVGASAPHCIDLRPGQDTTFQSNYHRVDIYLVSTLH